MLLTVPSNVQSKEVNRVNLEQFDDRIRVEIDGQLFTEYRYQGYAKPFLYPIIGPHNIGMTRNYPMDKTIEGEAADHPHHKSLWFTHGNVNGVDFWAEGPEMGRVVHDKMLCLEEEGDHATIQSANQWLDTQNQVVCSDQTTLAFSVLPEGQVIDWAVTLHASHGEVVFYDTKEGTMGLRTHPRLRLSNAPELGVVTASGRAINSQGVQGKEVWGKRAQWVDYCGEIDGKTVGIAIMDHPKNLRHPTWWHAREYGLVAANPFGIHDFEDRAEGTGDYTLPAGESLTLRYRFFFHKGDHEQAKTNEVFEQFSRSAPACSSGCKEADSQ